MRPKPPALRGVRNHARCESARHAVNDARHAPANWLHVRLLSTDMKTTLTPRDANSLWRSENASNSVGHTNVKSAGYVSNSSHWPLLVKLRSDTSRNEKSGNTACPEKSGAGWRTRGMLVATDSSASAHIATCHRVSGAPNELIDTPSPASPQARVRAHEQREQLVRSTSLRPSHAVHRNSMMHLAQHLAKPPSEQGARSASLTRLGESPGVVDSSPLADSPDASNVGNDEGIAFARACTCAALQPRGALCGA